MMRSVLWAVVMLLGSCMLQPAFLEHHQPHNTQHRVPEIVIEGEYHAQSVIEDCCSLSNYLHNNEAEHLHIEHS